MARRFMGSRWQIFLTIQLPNALPYPFGGMKISITLAIIGVIVSEFVASQPRDRLSDQAGRRSPRHDERRHRSRLRWAAK